MIVEFIGTTGAGKTTLISEVRRRLAGVTEVTTSFDLVASPLGLRDVTHPTARNLIQELVGLPFLLLSLRRHAKFILNVLRMLARQPLLSIFAVNNLRSLVRKLGVYEIIRRYGCDRIILVDEGTVLTAHNVFVYTDVHYSDEEIARFASLIPLPDLIVYIRAPAQSLVERSLRRLDPPREMKSKNRELNEKYIKRAVVMFEQLIRAQEISDRLLVVENPESTDEGRASTVDAITEFVLHFDPAIKRVQVS